MKHAKIYADSKDITLLEDGKIKVIGFIRDGLHFVNGGCIVPLVVELHYGTKHYDRAYFENGNLIYSDVWEGRPLYLLELYAKLAKEKELSTEEYIRRIVELYTYKELGLDNV